MIPWAAGLTDQPATGSDEKRNPIELTNQGLADDAVRPYNCRHLKKVGFGTLEKTNLLKKLWKEVFNPNPPHWKSNGNTMQIMNNCWSCFHFPIFQMDNTEASLKENFEIRD